MMPLGMVLLSEVGWTGFACVALLSRDTLGTITELLASTDRAGLDHADKPVPMPYDKLA